MAEVKSPAKPFRVGVLINPPCQLLDVSAVDLFGMMTPDYLKACQLPPPLEALAVEVDIQYISADGSGTMAECTSNSFLKITRSLKDADVKPGKLDVLVIPGPDPRLIPTEEVKNFIRAHADSGKSDILTICTGIFPAGYSGVLDGKQVTGPRGILGELKKQFPKANWVEKRWHQDGRLWTSAGITNGQEMVAAYLHSQFKKELADLICGLADTGSRGKDYENGSVSENSWWIWLIVRSWWKGKSK